MSYYLKPTKEEVIQRNKKFAEALRVNEKKAISKMEDSEGGRCCLCVAQHTAAELCEYIDKDDHEGYCCNLEVTKFFGWNVTMVKDFDGSYNELYHLNDGVNSTNSKFNYKEGVGLTHKQISEIIENTYVHPEDPKWVENGEAYLKFKNG